MIEKEIPLHDSNEFILSSSANVTFHDLFRMNDQKYGKWLANLKKVIFKSWMERGEPPTNAGDKETIIRQFETLVNKNETVSIHKDELTLEENCLVSNVVVSGTKHFFPNMCKMKDFNRNTEAGESLYKIFIEEPDGKQTEVVLKRLERQLKYDGQFEFSKKIKKGDVFDLDCSNAYDWVKKWNKKPIKGYDFFLDTSPPTKSQKGAVLTSPAKYLDKLIDEGEIKKSKIIWHGAKINYNKPLCVRIYKKDQRIFPKAFDILRRSVAMGGNFPSGVAKFLYQTYTEPNTESIIYDSSSGYGGRLVASLALCKDRQITYVGCDPNPDHYLKEYGITRYEYLRSFFQSAVKSNYKTKVDFYPVGSEVIHQEERFQQYKGKVDFFFTSPPYFNAEGYSDDEHQSFVKFPDYHLWRDGFLRPTLETAVEWLKPGGHLAWNIADISYGSKPKKLDNGKTRPVQQYLPLEYDSIEILQSLGMTYSKTWKMVLSGGISGNQIREWTRKPSTRNFVQLKSTPRKCELIFVWRKEG